MKKILSSIMICFSIAGLAGCSHLPDKPLSPISFQQEEVKAVKMSFVKVNLVVDKPISDKTLLTKINTHLSVLEPGTFDTDQIVTELRKEGSITDTSAFDVKQSVSYNSNTPLVFKTDKAKVYEDSFSLLLSIETLSKQTLYEDGYFTLVSTMTLHVDKPVKKDPKVIEQSAYTYKNKTFTRFYTPTAIAVYNTRKNTFEILVVTLSPLLLEVNQ